MARTLVAYDVGQANAPHDFVITNELGDPVAGSPFAATSKGAGTFRYTLDLPAALGAGYYTYVLRRNTQNRPRATGEFRLNATDILRPAATSEVAALAAAVAALPTPQTAAQVQARVAAALAAYDAPTRPDVDAVRAAVIAAGATNRDTITAAVAALNNLSDAQVATLVADGGALTRAQVIDSRDAVLGALNAAAGQLGTALGALPVPPTAQAIAIAVEAEIFDDSTGLALRDALVSQIEAAFANAGDDTDFVSLLQGAVSAAIAAAALATATDVTGARDTVVARVDASDAAREADVGTALTSYGAATQTSTSGVVTGARDLIIARIEALSNLSVADLDTAIAGFDLATRATLDALGVSLVGLLTADEDHDKAAGTLRKFTAGTSTVLVDKLVTVTPGADGCPERVTITEA